MIHSASIMNFKEQIHFKLIPIEKQFITDKWRLLTLSKEDCYLKPTYSFLTLNTHSV